MINKIRSSLILKIFLSMATVLVSTFVLFFIAVHIFFPVLYGRVLFNQFIELVIELEEELENMSTNEMLVLVAEFNSKHNANVRIIRNEEFIINPSLNTTENNIEVFTSRFTFETADGTAFMADIEIPSAPANQMTDIVISIMAFTFGLGVFISIAVAFVYSYYISKPIISISEVSNNMMQLDLTKRCKLTNIDMIGKLAYNFNEMADKLEQSFIDLADANQKLQHEMEKEREREKQRKDFFMAISHELKTPITILKIGLKGMIDNIATYQNHELHLVKLYETTEIMDELIQKLLTISQIKSNEITLNLDEKNIGDIVNEACQNHEDLALAKSIALTYYCEEDIFCMVDENQFKNVLSNIISNAIFYSPKGELIDIGLQKVKTHGILTIENHGVKINEDDLKQLFEPFYRIEKSRSKNTGGSGLGLFIVKNILDMHNFSYEIKNSDQGVLFTVTLPLLIIE